MPGHGPFDASALVAELATVLGPEQVLTDPASTASYEVDFTGRFGGRATAVVRPGSPHEVAAVLLACQRAGAAVVVQGGNTGLVGGGVPDGGEVVLSTRRLNTVGLVRTDADGGGASVVAGAGATLAAVQAAVRPVGWDVGVDLGSRESATVGGMVATNAGGEHVLRYGATREQVAGLSATLADGSVVGHLDRPAKSATGYDLEDLLVASEGTLGVVTEVRLRLVPLLRDRTVALVGVDGVQGALDVLAALRPTTPAPLTAAELVLPEGLALVRAMAGLPSPLSAEYPGYLLVEVGTDDVEAHPDGSLFDGLTAALSRLDGVRDATLAADATGMSRLWRYRESHTEAIALAGLPLKLDVSVPTERLAGFVAGLDAVVGAAVEPATRNRVRVIVFGHLAEGNLHVNVLGLDADDSTAVTDAVLRGVATLGGSISAEHGVGRAKVGWLSLSRTPDEIAAMTAVKRALDPTGMLAPGVLLPPSTGPDRAATS